MRVEISIEGIPDIEALIEGESETVSAFIEALPISGRVSRWGDEIYFYVDFEAPLERGARSIMEVGEMAFWPNGPALAIFFGPTPASKDEKPVAASDCNVIGRVLADPKILRKAAEGSKITIVAKA